MISQKTIQEVYDTARIEEVVQDFVSLKRRGSNLIGLCPFHHEKTPSFTVSPSKNLYKCFGCGKGGNVVNFVIEHENFTFPEAVTYLAKKYNIDIEQKDRTPEEIQAQQYSESLYVVNEFARKFYQDQLFNTDKGRSIGLNYFKERGYREETIKKFGLGYASDDRDEFTRYALQSGHKIEMLRQLGLTTEHDRDFFRNRVIFPIFNLSGKPIAFAGRIMAKDAKAPKYINSPETEIYNKSRSLFGLFQAKQAISKSDECILVEGYTDVITLHQAGIENVVASSGTALTAEQLRLIKRYTPHLKILYDGDPAGVKAALRGLDLALEQDLNVKIVLIPDGEDPDSYLKLVGATVFQDFLGQQAKDFILFKTELLLAETKGDPVKKAALIKDIVSSIARIPDPIKRSMFIQECSRVLQIEETTLVDELNRVLKNLMAQAKTKRDAARPDQSNEIAQNFGEVNETEWEKPKPAAQPKPVGDEFQEKDIVRILVSAGSQFYDEAANITIAEYILSNIEDIIESFEHKTYQRMVRECMDLLTKKLPISPQHFINHSDNHFAALSIDLLHSPFEMSKGWEERGLFLRSQKMPEFNFSKDSQQAVLRFKYKKIVRMCEQNQERLRGLGANSDTNQLNTLLKVQQRLMNMRDELAKQLGVVVLR